jgi:hypothetical protein
MCIGERGRLARRGRRLAKHILAVPLPPQNHPKTSGQTRNPSFERSGRGTAHVLGEAPGTTGEGARAPEYPSLLDCYAPAIAAFAVGTGLPAETGGGLIRLVFVPEVVADDEVALLPR